MGPGGRTGVSARERAETKQHVCGSFGHVRAISLRAFLKRLHTILASLQKVGQFCPGFHRQSVMGEHGG